MASIIDLFFPALGAALGVVAGLITRSAIVPRLARMARFTGTTLDDALLRAARGPLLIWTTLIGAAFGFSFADVAPALAGAMQRTAAALVIVSVSWTLASAVSAMVHAPRSATARLPSARILSSAARGAVLAIGALVALQTLGVSVAPVLTALGVGGLAVGLALQDTLANLFAGIQVLVSRQVRPGDFVQLASGEQGFVEDIAWRNTTIRQLPNNIVIVPNAKLAQALTVNYSLPDAEQATLVDVGVSYDDDLGHVERVTVDVARSVQREIDGAVRTFEPFVRFHTFGESSIDMTVIMRANQFTDNYLMKHEFREATARALSAGRHHDSVSAADAARSGSGAGVAADLTGSESGPGARSRALARSRASTWAVLITAACENACGKLPRCAPVSGSIASP